MIMITIAVMSLPFYSQVGRALGHDPSLSQDTVFDPFSAKVLSVQVTTTEFPPSIPFKSVGELSIVSSGQTEKEILC